MPPPPPAPRTPRTHLDDSRRRGARSTSSTLTLCLLALAACGRPGSNKEPPDGVTPGNHRWFPIDGGVHGVGATLSDGTMACESCHPTKDNYLEFTCVSCHGHEPLSTTLLHTSVAGFAYSSKACYACHPDGAHLVFDHAGIVGNCATCHDVGAPFAALPKASFTHPSRAGLDCGSCHVTSTWGGGTVAPVGVFDPAHDLVLDGLVPTWSATTIVSVSAQRQTLTMPMNHGATAVDRATMAACASCHPDSSAGVYFPGLLHSSLVHLDAGQPTTCGECHGPTRPVGFVGSLATARAPPTPEMRHEAVAWDGGRPTSAALVTADCAVCHVSPSKDFAATWALIPDGGVPRFHASLAAAGQPQPASCLDCHANSRAAKVLTSLNSSLPPTLQFDHSVAETLGDCAGCHAQSGAAPFASWAGGRFHQPGSATPSTCLPCHAGGRPLSAAGWASTSYASSPFDYGTNDAGVTHGDGQDCVLCHGGPGTGGAWGSAQSWVGGHYGHDAGTPAELTCLACHSTQRPDVQPGATAASMKALIGFDHAQDGIGDCVGCHQATVQAGTYVHYVDPATGSLPNGDWKGGIGYPGSTLVSAPGQQLTLSTLRLNRAAASGLVTGMTAVSTTLSNAMLHASAAVPAQVNAGSTAAPDYTKCWHCHTNTAGTVTSLANGKFHAALTAYAATPGATPTPLPQPTSGCKDCHAQMRPPNIVEKAASSLLPMDHTATFQSPVTIGGVTASGVADLDCSLCHKNAGSGWADGLFHAPIGAAVPADCVTCHYPLMADAAKADVTVAKDYTMAHRSTELTSQACQSCHATALGAAKTTPATALLWKTGAYHPKVTAQPTACVDCHAVSMPAAGTPTQSSWTYSLAKGSTPTNQGQWMNHGSLAAVGKDCAACHLADAKPVGSAWLTSDLLHGPVPKPATCQECHGLKNGGGAVAGTKNNLPSGLTDTPTVSSASYDGGTGLAPGTLVQLSHLDGTVANRECSFCHTQSGIAATAPAAGKEWAQARFHLSFTAASPLVTNGTTARCSTCHLNVKPTAIYMLQDHSSFTAAPGTVDCGACHSWPGTGTTLTPNWLGGAAMPPYISVGGFVIPAPPAATPVSQTGIANLPHPAVATGTPCTTCHQTSAGGRRATGYDHASALINARCNACHEAGSDLVGTAWNQAASVATGAGDTRPFTLASVTASYKGNSLTVTYPKHFYPVDCAQCHVVPAGTGAVTTGTAWTTAWRFPHIAARMTDPSTCAMCHGNNIPR